MVEKPRARRYPLAASIEMVEMGSGMEVRGQTIDISTFGCRVNAVASWVVGTKIRLRIFYRGAVLSAAGSIANMRPNGAIGVAFSKLEDKQQLLLEKWLTDLRDTRERTSARK